GAAGRSAFSCMYGYIRRCELARSTAMSASTTRQVIRMTRSAMLRIVIVCPIPGRIRPRNVIAEPTTRDRDRARQEAGIRRHAARAPRSTRPARTRMSAWGRRPLGRSAMLRGAPHLARDLEGQPELALLVVDRDLVAVVRAGEAALRAQAEVLERH